MPTSPTQTVDNTGYHHEDGPNPTLFHMISLRRNWTLARYISGFYGTMMSLMTCLCTWRNSFDLFFSCTTLWMKNLMQIQQCLRPPWQYKLKGVPAKMCSLFPFSPTENVYFNPTHTNITSTDIATILIAVLPHRVTPTKVVADKGDTASQN